MEKMLLPKLMSKDLVDLVVPVLINKVMAQVTALSVQIYAISNLRQ